MWFATTSGGCNADVLCFRALDKKYAYLLKSIMFQDGFFDYVMSGAKGTKMPRGDKTHIMLYPIPRFSETQLLKFIEYNRISFGEGGRMRSLSRVSRKQRYSTLDFPAENRVPTGMQNSPESIKAFAVFDVTFNIYTGLDLYGWHHLRRTCCRSAPWLCTVFLCEVSWDFWNERLSRSSYLDSCYDFAGRSFADCAFPRFKQ